MHDSNVPKFGQFGRVDHKSQNLVTYRQPMKCHIFYTTTTMTDYGGVKDRKQAALRTKSLTDIRSPSRATPRARFSLYTQRKPKGSLYGDHASQVEIPKRPTTTTGQVGLRKIASSPFDISYSSSGESLDLVAYGPSLLNERPLTPPRVFRTSMTRPPNPPMIFSLDSRIYPRPSPTTTESYRSLLTVCSASSSRTANSSSMPSTPSKPEASANELRSGLAPVAPLKIIKKNSVTALLEDCCTSEGVSVDSSARAGLGLECFTPCSVGSPDRNEADGATLTCSFTDVEKEIYALCSSPLVDTQSITVSQDSCDPNPSEPWSINSSEEGSRALLPRTPFLTPSTSLLSESMTCSSMSICSTDSGNLSTSDSVECDLFTAVDQSEELVDDVHEDNRSLVCCDSQDFPHEDQPWVFPTCLFRSNDHLPLPVVGQIVQSFSLPMLRQVDPPAFQRTTSLCINLTCDALFQKRRQSLNITVAVDSLSSSLFGSVRCSDGKRWSLSASICGFPSDMLSMLNELEGLAKFLDLHPPQLCLTDVHTPVEDLVSPMALKASVVHESEISHLSECIEEDSSPKYEESDDSRFKRLDLWDDEVETPELALVPVFPSFGSSIVPFGDPSPSESLSDSILPYLQSFASISVFPSMDINFRDNELDFASDRPAMPAPTFTPISLDFATPILPETSFSDFSLKRSNVLLDRIAFEIDRDNPETFDRALNEPPVATNPQRRSSVTNKLLHIFKRRLSDPTPLAHVSHDEFSYLHDRKRKRSSVSSIFSWFSHRNNRNSLEQASVGMVRESTPPERIKPKRRLSGTIKRLLRMRRV